MQYLVNTKGEVTIPKVKAYVVNAKTKQEAQIIASEKFAGEFGVPNEYINTNPHKRTYNSIIACGLMLIPVLLAFFDWTIGHEKYSIQPNAISCIFAVLIYAAFVVKIKGIHRTIGTVTDIALMATCILLLATCIESLLTYQTFDLVLFDVNVDTRVILVFAVILSWLGLKLVSVVCMGVIFVFAISNIVKLSEAMGKWGIIFILSAFLGVLFYLSVEPAVVEAGPFYKKVIYTGINRVHGDVMDAGQSAKSIYSKHKDRAEVENDNSYLDRED